jgi:hypothetical protein
VSNDLRAFRRTIAETARSPHVATDGRRIRVSRKPLEKIVREHEPGTVDTYQTGRQSVAANSGRKSLIVGADRTLPWWG